MSEEREREIRLWASRGALTATEAYLLARLDEARERGDKGWNRVSVLMDEAEKREARVAQMREALDELLGAHAEAAAIGEWYTPRLHRATANAEAALFSSPPSQRWEAAMRVIEQVPDALVCLIDHKFEEGEDPRIADLAQAYENYRRVAFGVDET